MADAAAEGQGGAPSAPPSTGRAELARLVAAATQDPAGTLELMLRRSELAQAAYDQTSGTEHLLFICADVACALPLTALREVLHSVPRVVPLPFSPDWLLGIFPLRSEMLGLADPAPFLFGDLAGTLAPQSSLGQLRRGGQDSASSRPGHPPMPALVVGVETRSLALAVRAVGDIAQIEASEIQPRSSALTSGPAPCTEAYLAGIYRPQQGPPRLILDAERLLVDLLSALEEKDERYG